MWIDGNEARLLSKEQISFAGATDAVTGKTIPPEPLVTYVDMADLCPGFADAVEAEKPGFRPVVMQGGI